MEVYSWRGLALSCFPLAILLAGRTLLAQETQVPIDGRSWGSHSEECWENSQLPLLWNKSPYTSGKVWKMLTPASTGKASRACTWLCEQAKHSVRVCMEGNILKCESVHGTYSSVVSDWLDGGKPSSLPFPRKSAGMVSKQGRSVSKEWNCVGCVSGSLLWWPGGH